MKHGGVRGRDRRGCARRPAQAVELGHPDVHQHDVRAPPAHDVHRGAPRRPPRRRRAGRARRRGSRGTRSAAAPWSSAITTVISVAPPRRLGGGPRRAGAPSPPVTGSPTPGIRSAPAGRRWPATRRPATWRTDLRDEDLAGARRASHRPVATITGVPWRSVALAGPARPRRGRRCTGSSPASSQHLRSRSAAPRRRSGTQPRARRRCCAPRGRRAGARCACSMRSSCSRRTGVGRLVTQAPEQRRRAHELGHEDRHERRLHPLAAIIVARRGRSLP